MKHIKGNPFSQSDLHKSQQEELTPSEKSEEEKTNVKVLELSRERRVYKPMTDVQTQKEATATEIIREIARLFEGFFDVQVEVRADE